jgi:nucleoside-diphosphate-sugar epimerase
MDVLITGGTGLLGHHLVPALQDRGHTVRVLALPGEEASWLERRDVEVFRGDVRRPETLVVPIRGCDAVIHLAVMMGVWRPFAD